MKKIIIVVCIVLSILGLFITALPLILKVTGLDKPVKDYLISNLLAESEHQVDLEQINIGLGECAISHVSFRSEDEKIEILVDEIVLDFNIFELIKSPTEPQNSLREIYFHQPQLIVHKTRANNPASAKPANPADLFSNLVSISKFKYLRIDDARIACEDDKGNLISYAENLNGWLDAGNDEKISVNVQGNIFSTKSDNFKVNFDIDKNTEDFSSRFDIYDYNFDQEIVNHFIGEAGISGSGSGYFTVTGNASDINSFLVNGDLKLSNIAVAFKDENVDSLNFDINIKNNYLTLQNGNFLYRKQPVLISGIIKNIFKPNLDGTLIIPHMQIAAFNKIFPTDLFNGSTFSATLKFATDFSDFNINGDVGSTDFSIYKQNFSSLSANVIFSANTLKIPSLIATSGNFNLNASGNYSIAEKDLNLNLHGTYASGEHVFFNRINNAMHSVDLQLFFDTESGASAGNWNYNIAGFDTVLSLAGNIIGTNKDLNINVLESNSDHLKASIKVSNYFSVPDIQYASLENFPFSAFTSEKIVHGLFEKINTKLFFSGKLNNLHGLILATEKESKDTIFTMDTDIKDLTQPHKKISGNVSLKNLKGRYDIDFDPEFFGSYFRFNESIDGNFFINLKNVEELSGEINIENLKIVQALSGIAAREDYRYQGEINGKINIFGSLKEPQVKGYLAGEKFVLNEIGYYQPKIDFRIDRTKIVADSINIFHNNINILNGSLSWGLLNNQIQGGFNGSDLNVETLFKTFSLDETLLTGTANYQFRVKGTADNPHIEADLEIVNGAVDGILFDEMEINLVDKIPEKGNFFSYTDHKIELQKLFIGRAGHYHFNSVGTFPFNTKEQADILVSFDGDILGLLPHWEPFFKDGTSLADITLNFKGSSDQIHLHSADIKIDRGELWMNDVAPHVKDISGRILLKPGSKKVDIINLKAFVDDNYLTINTVRDIVTDAGIKLKHWDFKGLNLDFGILALQTSSDGVSLHIPGIMGDNEYGSIRLTGKSENEPFFFAGPIKHPLGYGKVFLSDSYITYPFLTGDGPPEKPSTAVLFLSNMEWDILLNAGEGVVYTRDIPAYIDNVRTEITVDESSKGLEFKGIINKGTFKPIGNLVSTRGRLEYLDQNFKVDRFELEFTRLNDLPDVSGRAWTTIRDSVGAVPKTIYLQLYALDSENQETRQSGNWEDFKFKLVSADPVVGETQEQVLAYLGYSVENIKEKATNVGGAITEKYLIRPLIRPLEKALEQGLGMDLVRFNSSIARNLFYSSMGKQFESEGTNPFVNPLSGDVPYLFLMSSSELTVGKYLSENLYLTYTGQLVSIYDETETGLDINHSIGLEYRFLSNILLEFAWDRELLGIYNFDNQRKYLEDFKIRLRHSFSF